MTAKLCVLLCVLLIVNHINAFVVSSSDKENLANDLLNVFKKAIDQMRECLDQLMAKTVDQVNPQKLEPVIDAVGDRVNRITKAVEDLTAPSSKSKYF